MKKYWAAIFLFVLFPVFGQNYQMHGLYMFTFTKYIQWPAAYNQGDFEITVFGDSPVVAELKKLEAKKVTGDRAIKVTKITSLGEIKKCNILFIPADKSGQLPDILTKIGANSTLVVTEQTGLALKGSAINFVTKDGKLVFEINQAVMNKQQLKASLELTRMAIVI